MDGQKDRWKEEIDAEDFVSTYLVSAYSLCSQLNIQAMVRLSFSVKFFAKSGSLNVFAHHGMNVYCSKILFKTTKMCFTQHVYGSFSICLLLVINPGPAVNLLILLRFPNAVKLFCGFNNFSNPFSFSKCIHDHVRLNKSLRKTLAAAYKGKKCFIWNATS